MTAVAMSRLLRQRSQRTEPHTCVGHGGSSKHYARLDRCSTSGVFKRPVHPGNSLDMLAGMGAFLMPVV